MAPEGECLINNSLIITEVASYDSKNFYGLIIIIIIIISFYDNKRQD